MSHVMINERMAGVIEDMYLNPQRKQCLFTGNAHAGVAKALGREVWDWTPQPIANVEPWYWNTHTLPLTFGCNPVFTSEGKEWLTPRISNPDQVADIEIPDVWSGRTGEILRAMQRMLNELPQETLIRLPDIQSPLGVAELMWDQSFYMALLLNPEEVHTLLDKITQFTIRYIRAIQKVLGARYCPATHPQVWASGTGFYMSDDVNSMVSPEQHLEYSVQYTNRLSDELGPLYFHSCTWRQQYFDNFDQIRNIRSANWSFGSSIDPADLFERFSGKFVLAPHIGHDTHLESAMQHLRRPISSAYDLVKYLLDYMQSNTALYINLMPELCNDIGQMIKIYRLFEERGYAPKGFLDS